MNKQYIIARMTKDEINLAVSWAAKEGWNPGLNDADCFYQTDPEGFFVGKLDEKIIAVGSAVNYDEKFSFCGFYIVDKAYRNQGYGLALTKARLAYVGDRNAGIDGVISMLDKYERLGYRKAHNNARYESIQAHPEEKNPYIQPLNKIDFSQLNAYDRRHFPAPREAFLKCWINQRGSKSLGYLEEETLKGYGVIRPCLSGFKIGPLFADTPHIAESLFKNLAHHAQGKPYYLDIPENNPNALDLINRHEFKKVFETARMYLKGEPDLAINNIYGITTFELG